MSGYGRWPVRVAAYLVGTPIVAYVAMAIASHYEDVRRYCPEPDLDADCDSALVGVVWGYVGVAVWLVVVVIIESALWSKRINRRAELEGGYDQPRPPAASGADGPVDEAGLVDGEAEEGREGR